MKFSNINNKNSKNKQKTKRKNYFRETKRLNSQRNKYNIIIKQSQRL